MESITIFNRRFFMVFALCSIFLIKGQAQSNLDSLILELEEETVAFNKAELHLQIAKEYFKVSNDSGLEHTQSCLDLAINNKKIEVLVFGAIKGLSYTLSETSDFKVALAGFEQLRTYSNQTNNDSLLAVSNYGKTAILMGMGEPLKALDLMEEVIEFAKRGTINEVQELSIYNMMATIYVVIDDVELAISYTMDALRLAEKNKVLTTAASCYNRLSEIYRNQNKYDKAFEYAEKGMELEQKIGHPIRLSMQYNHFASIYYMRSSDPNNENSADDMALHKKYTEKSLKTALAGGNKSLEGLGYLNLGNYYRNHSIYDTAAVFYTKGLDLFILIGDRPNENTTYNNLAISYGAQSRKEKDKDRRKSYLEKAIFYGEKSFENTDKFGMTKNKITTAHLLSDIYADVGNDKEAYKYLKIYSTLTDSLYNKEKLQIAEDLEVKYKTEKKELSIKNLNQEKALQLVENKQQKVVLYLIGGALSVVLLLLGLLYWFFAQKKQANAELISKNGLITQQKKIVDQQNEEKELLLKEIHHRVKNNLQIISSLLDLQSSKIDDDAARSAIADGQSRVKSMALIHHKLYQHENIATINIKEYVGQLFDQIMTTLTTASPNLVLEIDEQVSFDIDTAIPLGLILNELLTNACKYAFEEGKQGKLSIRLQEKEEGNYLMEVKDNGNGMPADFNLGKARSLGLRLVRRLSKQLLGKATYKNDNGACFCIEFKNTALRKTID